MTSSVLGWAAIALLLFWSVGAYNRLVRMRSQATSAFQSLYEALGRYGALVQDALGTDAATVASPADGNERHEAAAARASLQAAGAQYDLSLRTARRQPLDPNGMAALQTALAALQTAWVKLQNAQVDAADTGPAAAARLQWAENEPLATQAAAGFNRAVSGYNAAVTQFPALLLAHVFSFRVAGCL